MAKQRDVVVRFLADTKGLQSGLTETEARLSQFAKKVDTGTNSLGAFAKETVKIKSATDVAKLGIENLGSKVMSLGSGIPVFGGLLEKIGNISPMVKGAVVGIALLTGSIVGMVSAGAEAETQLTSMSVLLKQQGFTMSDTKKFYQDMMQFAAETPLRTNEVVDAAKRLLAVGIPKAKIKDDLRDIGNVAAGSGKNFIELIDIMAKNKTQGIIQGEDLRQMVSAGIPIMDEFKKMTGKSAEEIKKMGEKGTLTYDMMAKAMHNMANAGGIYENMMEKQSKTVAGLWSTIQDDVSSTFRSMSGVLADENVVTFWFRLKEIMGDVAKFTGSFFKDNAGRFQELGAVIGNMLMIIWQTGKTAIEVFRPLFSFIGLMVGYAVDIGLAIAKWSGSAIIGSLRVIASLFSNIWDMAGNIAKFFYNITGAASLIGYLIDKISLFVTAIKFDISLAGLYIHTVVAEWSKAIDNFLDKHPSLKFIVGIATGKETGKVNADKVRADASVGIEEQKRIGELYVEEQKKKREQKQAQTINQNTVSTIDNSKTDSSVKTTNVSNHFYPAEPDQKASLINNTGKKVNTKSFLEDLFQ